MKLKKPWSKFADFIRSHLMLAVGIAGILGLIYGQRRYGGLAS